MVNIGDIARKGLMVGTLGASEALFDPAGMSEEQMAGLAGMIGGPDPYLYGGAQPFFQDPTQAAYQALIQQQIAGLTGQQFPGAAPGMPGVAPQQQGLSAIEEQRLKDAETRYRGAKAMASIGRGKDPGTLESYLAKQDPVLFEMRQRQQAAAAPAPRREVRPQEQTGGTRTGAPAGGPATVPEGFGGGFTSPGMPGLQELSQMQLAAARGEGPSAAQLQLQRATERGLAQASALAASGGGTQLAQRRAQEQAAMIGQEAGREAAILRAQEQQAAQAQAGQTLGAMQQLAQQRFLGQRGQDIQFALGMGGQALQGQALTDAQLRAMMGMGIGLSESPLQRQMAFGGAQQQADAARAATAAGLANQQLTREQQHQLGILGLTGAGIGAGARMFGSQ